MYVSEFEESIYQMIVEFVHWLRETKATFAVKNNDKYGPSYE